nr:MAG: hypothetical protein TU35_06865 [Thermoproteus sp. AZ2]
MLGDAQNARLVVTKIPLDVAKQLLAGGNFVSAIGHAATADLLTRLLGVQVPMNRVAIKLNPGDAVLVFQLRGRLPEGAVIQNPEELEKIGYDFWLVQLE